MSALAPAGLRPVAPSRPNEDARDARRERVEVGALSAPAILFTVARIFARLLKPKGL